MLEIFGSQVNAIAMMIRILPSSPSMTHQIGGENDLARNALGDEPEGACGSLSGV